MTEKTKLKYYLEFSELVENVENITDDELIILHRRLEKHLKDFVRFSGIQLEDFKLEFDVEE